MKERYRVHRGFTLAEVAIVFTIIGFIAAATIGVYKFKQNEVKKHMTFAAFQSLKEFSGNNMADGNELITPATSGTAAYSESVEVCDLDLSCNSCSEFLSSYDDYLFYLAQTNLYCFSAYSEGLCTMYKSYVQDYYKKYTDIYNTYFYNLASRTDADTNYVLNKMTSIQTQHGQSSLSCPGYPGAILNEEMYKCFSDKGLILPTEGNSSEYQYDTFTARYTSPRTNAYNNGITSYDNTVDYLCGVGHKEINHDAVPATAETKTVEKALPETGAKLCEKAVDLLNIVGESHCSDASAVNDASDFKSATPSFSTPNSLVYYNVQANPSAGTAGDYSTQVYTIYIDIDGLNRGKSKLNDDVVKFLVRRDGVVLPAADSVAANNTDYLTAAIKSENSWLGVGLTYRKAACQSGFIKGNYCLATGSYPAYSIATSCSSHFCNVYTSTPKLKFF